MSYRKIVVNEKTYEYTIGKTYTKIKTIGVFKNVDIGVNFYYEDWDEYRLQVLPSHVKAVIEQHL